MPTKIGVWVIDNSSCKVYQSVFQPVCREGRIDREGLSKRRRKEGGGKKKKKKETLQDEGAAEEKGQLLFLSYGNGNEVGHGAQDNRGLQAG